MGRPREFDPEEATRGAMDVFWRQGFKATNLPDLLSAMGLSRGSFYKAYGEKEAAYLAALDHYDKLNVSQVVAALDACDAGRAEACLSILFEGGASDRKGCFICNAMVEVAPDNPEVAAKAAAMADRLRGAIERVIDRYGSGPSPQNAQTAGLVLHLYFGYQAMGRAGHRSPDWRAQLTRLIRATEA